MLAKLENSNSNLRLLTQESKNSNHNLDQLSSNSSKSRIATLLPLPTHQESILQELIQTLSHHNIHHHPHQTDMEHQAPLNQELLMEQLQLKNQATEELQELPHLQAAPTKLDHHIRQVAEVLLEQPALEQPELVQLELQVPTDLMDQLLDLDMEQHWVDQELELPLHQILELLQLELQEPQLLLMEAEAEAELDMEHSVDQELELLQHQLLELQLELPLWDPREQELQDMEPLALLMEELRVA